MAKKRNLRRVHIRPEVACEYDPNEKTLTLSQWRRGVRFDVVIHLGGSVPSYVAKQIALGARARLTEIKSELSFKLCAAIKDVSDLGGDK